jgi:hypothetical protein
MTEPKNLKVSFQVHEMMNRRRKVLGVKQQTLTDALLLQGLKMSNEEIQKAVVNLQLTLPTESTNEEPQPE